MNIAEETRLDTEETAAAAQCPACREHTMRLPEVMNALSRYCSEYICSPCGTREAFEGFFWKSNAVARGFVEA